MSSEGYEAVASDEDEDEDEEKEEDEERDVAVKDECPSLAVKHSRNSFAEIETVGLN